MINPLLEIKNLTMKFGGVTALNEVNLYVNEKEIAALIGPNGAGKSTLFNLLSGSFLPDSGSVFINDQDITRLNPEARLAAGMARSFQITNLFFDLSVIENLQIASQALEPKSRLYLPSSRSELAIQRAEDLLREFELVGSRHLLAGSLSHGEQRRLEIAVTLATKPSLLLLDEPTQGMSQADTQETADLIMRLGANITVLLIEHDVDLVMNLSKKVIVMAQGCKLAEGAPDAVRSNPVVQAAYFGEEAI